MIEIRRLSSLRIWTLAHSNQERTRKERNKEYKKLRVDNFRLLLRVRSISFFNSCVRGCCESPYMHYTFLSSSLFYCHDLQLFFILLSHTSVVPSLIIAPAAPVAVLLAPTTVVPCLFLHNAISLLPPSHPFPPSLSPSFRITH